MEFYHDDPMQLTISEAGIIAFVAPSNLTSVRVYRDRGVKSTSRYRLFMLVAFSYSVLLLFN